jgi:pimeloyl-ACP methyl ester carboxylesterase
MDTSDEGAGSETGSSTPDTRTIVVAVVVGLVLVASGTSLAYWVTTSGGEISVEDTTFETDSGIELAATVYEPSSATIDEPAPAVVLIHGHGGERGTMSSFAQEFAERGYVAVAVDQPGHRDSEPPAYEDGWGGPAALEYTRSLETTDEDSVSMVGHSMGGFASLAAAKEHPEGYESVVLVGSTWGISGAPAANTTFPRNMAVVFSPYDEYAPVMYGESVPGKVTESEKLTSAFGTQERVEPGKIYGNVEEGTARRYTAPRTVHTGMHRSTATVADTVEWVTLTTEGEEEDEEAQSWYLTTFGHVIAFIGAFVVAVGVAGIAWRRFGSFADSGMAEDNDDGKDGWASRWVLLGITALPALALYPLYALGTVLVPVTRITHQELTHGYVLWALGTVAVGASVASWRYGWRETLLGSFSGRTSALRTLLAAIAGFAAVYLVVLAASTVHGSGFRAWMVGLAPLPGFRWFSVAVYLVPLTVGTVALSAALEHVLPERTGVLRHVGLALVVSCGGLIASLAVQYVPLFLGFGLPVPILGALAITGIWSTFLLGCATVIAAATTRLTDEALVGGILAGLVVTWMIAGTGPMTVTPF